MPGKKFTSSSPSTAVKVQTRPVQAKKDRHFVTALVRGLDVLSAFSSRDRMLGNQELELR